MSCARALSHECCRDRVLGTREDDEEGVSLRVDFLAVRAVESVAEEELVLGEHFRVALAETGGEPGGALDVREEKRDGAARKNVSPRHGVPASASTRTATSSSGR